MMPLPRHSATGRERSGGGPTRGEEKEHSRVETLQGTTLPSSRETKNLWAPTSCDREGVGPEPTRELARPSARTARAKGCRTRASIAADRDLLRRDRSSSARLADGTTVRRGGESAARLQRSRHSWLNLRRARSPLV